MLLFSAIACPSVHTPSFGKVSQGYGSFGTTLTYTCNNKYRLNGPSERVCGADGKWSGTEPVCQGKHLVTFSSCVI